MSACYCDFEQPSFYREQKRKASKPHRCCECGATIAPSEVYQLSVGLWDGEFSVYKTCPRCLALVDYVKASIPCFCWAFTEMREYAIETVREFAHELPGLLFGAYRLEVKIRQHAKTNKWVKPCA